MFDQIGKILEKFTTGQRVIVLMILLVSIVLISLGPSLIANNDCKEPLQQIEIQRKELLKLNSEIIGIQTQCTNERLIREKEISDLLSTIKSEVNMIESHTYSASRTLIRENSHTVIEPEDSLHIIPSPSPRIILPTPPDFTKIKGALREMQEIVDKDSN